MSTKILAVQPVLMSRDIQRSLAFYARLGFKTIFIDSTSDPKYAGVSRDGIELHLQWHDAAEWLAQADRPTYRFVVEDVDALHEMLWQAGIADMTSPHETAWSTYEFHVRDPDGNGLQFYRDVP